jgi:hypothetical protein
MMTNTTEKRRREGEKRGENVNEMSKEGGGTKPVGWRSRRGGGQAGDDEEVRKGEKGRSTKRDQVNNEDDEGEEGSVDEVEMRRDRRVEDKQRVCPPTGGGRR